MGILSNLLFGEKQESTSDKTVANKIIPYYPNIYHQDTNKSVVDANHRYDLRRFSKHEADIIRSVLQTVDKKYPKPFRSLGLANETCPIKYKARYVLFDIIILQYENSNNPIDRIAVAFAYESKGAFFRKQAISYFEDAMNDLDVSILSKFSSYAPMISYLKFAELYEKEHDYRNAITCAKKARNSKGANKAYCTELIEKLEKKLKSPPRTRKSKKPDYYDDFERDVRKAAIAFTTGNFSGIELNVRPNHSIYK